ncbi:radical SAM protein [Bacillus paralicheniformis]|uniref:radical SAM protein n=1 Tax=Bacillus paralicheniformis TaxID=1648923 RepID=UPI00128DDEA6|nr:radical SAM protein [Bacillus paralicheniformis]MPQ26950.1 radical SAM protein [Bacillus paralicheniformis]
MAEQKLSMMPFKTEKFSYILDGNTGRVIVADQPTVFIISNYYKFKKEELIIKAKEIFAELHKDYNVLYNYVSNLINMRMFYVEKTDNSELYIDSRELAINSNQSQLILILTEKCNLRCEYCIYNDKYPKEMGYSDEEMDFETAKKAVDMYYELHMERIKRGYKRYPVITMYGGEPLLKFDLIKKVMDYAKGLMPNTLFYTTTNGTLLSEKMMDYFIENRIIITFSIDGFKENHDRNRVFINGMPTFERALKNIKRLQEKKKKQNIKQVISFNCCFDQYTNVYKVAKFFEENYDLFNPFFVLYNQINPFDTLYFDWCEEQVRTGKWKLDKNNFKNAMNKIEHEVYEVETCSDRFKQVAGPLVMKDFVLSIRNKDGKQQITRNSCIPTSKIAVSPDGTLTLCEKMCKKYPIGTIEKGIDWGAVNYVTDKLVQHFNSDSCKYCPIRTMCEACFMFLDENGRIKPSFCKSKKTAVIKNLESYFAKKEKGFDVMKVYNHTSDLDSLKEMVK